MRIYTGSISAVSAPYPGFIRVRLSHPDFQWTRPIGDFYIKLLLEPAPDGLTDFRPQDFEMRTYTIADCGPGWVDVDCVDHQPTGPGTDWFLAATPGAPFSIIAPSPGEELWAPALKLPDCERRIAIVDATAYPALLNMEQESTTPITALLYGFDPQDHHPTVDSWDGIVEWLDQFLGGQLLRPVCTNDSEPYIWDLASDSSRTQFFFAGESGLIKKLRRYTLSKGVERSAVSFMGYWRLPVPPRS
ncbi:MAG: siderophore-interacting protein [Corynebacterium sp.]|nr:siderophore-interacting protein [Corynebacterium sp.]